MKNLLGYARFITIDTETLKSLKRTWDMTLDSQALTQIEKGYLPLISTKNEVKAWKMLSTVIDGALEQFEDTLAQDSLVLETDKYYGILNDNKRNCVYFRQGKKRLLKYLKDCAIMVDKINDRTRFEAKNFMNTYDNLKYSKYKYFKVDLISALVDPDMDEYIDPNDCELIDRF